MSRKFEEWFFESGQYTLDSPSEYIYVPIGGFPEYGVCKDGFVMRDGHILKNKKGDREGHLAVCLSDGKRRAYKYVHRLVADAFIPNPDNLPIVRHLNDDRNDNRVENLAWGTQTDNHDDAVRNGTYVPFSDECRRKSVETTRRPVRVTNVKTGEQEDFYSLNEACRAKGLVQANVCRVLRGEGHTVNGYFVEYLEKEAMEWEE